MTILRCLVPLFFLSVSLGLAQEAQPALRNEILLFGEYSGFTDPGRSAHRIGTLQYYRTLSPGVKVFADVTATRRFDRTDGSAGAGAYYIPDQSNSFYGFLAAGFNPEVVPKIDVSLEYTRLIIPRLTASIGYRGLAFSGETVHMAIPGVTVYAIPRWTLTGKVFCARLRTDARLRATFLFHAGYDIDETWMPEVYYTLGSEAFRATSLDLVASQHAWSLTVGGKVQLSDNLRLRLHAMHGVRAGAFEENGLDCAFSFLW